MRQSAISRLTNQEMGDLIGKIDIDGMPTEAAVSAMDAVQRGFLARLDPSGLMDLIPAR